jgi:uncharacterized protein (DUF362 family)
MFNLWSALLVEKGIGEVLVNPYKQEDKALVGKVSNMKDLKESILKAVDLIGGFYKVIEEGDEVLLKPNYNSSDPPPASSEPEFVKAVIELLYEHGAGKVVVGESSMEALTTRKVMEKTGTLDKMKETKAELVFFDEGKWVKVNVGGKYLKTVSLPERVLQVKKVVYCCCMKTHFRADFSLSLKLAFGFVKGSERPAFHLRHLKEKIVDLNLVVHPNLVIVDGRKCFITGGPFKGEVREPNVILTSGDRIAMDVEAIKIIESFKGSKLKDDPWSYTQIRRAVELGLGAKDEQEYKIITK